MNVTVFGATGQIGQFVVRHLLDAGHEVTALVRSPEKMAVESTHLDVVVAELDDAAAVEKVVAPADAVISTLGPPIDRAASDHALTDGMRAIVAAMRRHDVRRLIALSTVSVPDPRDRPGILDRLVPVGIRALIPNALAEVQGITEAVTTSGLDWTVVRMFAPVDNPPNGTLRVGYLGRDDLGVAMTRTDVAAFLVGQLTDTTYVGAAPAISN